MSGSPGGGPTSTGADAEILKADVIFRAVVCPRGRHVVRFTFHPFAGAFAEMAGKVMSPETAMRITEYVHRFG